jgi:hypothetical protein
MSDTEYTRGYTAGFAQGFKQGTWVGWLKAIASRVMWIVVGAISYIILKAI